MTRIAVLSDIHANILALEAVVKDVRQEGADILVFLGDLIMAGPRPAETLELMKSLNPDVWILGNTDDWPKEVDENFVPGNPVEERVAALSRWGMDRLEPEALEVFRGKPVAQPAVYDGRKLVFCHGSPASYSLGLVPDLKPEGMNGILEDPLMQDGVEALFCGHTHRRFVMRIDGLDIVNFGSFCIPGEDPSRYARYGIVEIRPGHMIYRPRDVEYDFDAYIRDLRVQKYPDLDTILAKHGL